MNGWARRLRPLDLTRIDLADIHAPQRLADAIHRQLGPIDRAVPVDEIAHALDIDEIRRERLDGLEGMLLTNRARSFGSILVNITHGARRARFSVGHELGHFLLERHVLSQDNGFRCTSWDMLEARDDTRQRKQEAEANHFAAALLAPAYKMRSCLGNDPDLRTLQSTADALDLSLEATIRRYLDLVDVPVAAIWTKDGRIRTSKRHRDFPWVTRQRGDALSDLTQAWRASRNARPGFTDMAESAAAAWTDRDGVEIYEQTRVGRNGHAVTLLRAELPDDDDADDGGPTELGMPGFGKSRRRK